MRIGRIIDWKLTFVLFAIVTAIFLVNLADASQIGGPSVEVGFTSLSPRGTEGGSIVPASCESAYAHWGGECSDLTFWADSYSVPYGGATTLRWSTSGYGWFLGCTASGAWSGAKASSGAQGTGSLYSPPTYTLSCTFQDTVSGALYTITRSLSITVGPPPQNGACASPPNGSVYSSAPSSGLCSAQPGGVSGVATNASTYNWTCFGANGGSNASCAAYRSPVCGSSSGGTFSSPPLLGLCSVGSPSSVTTNATTYTWSCTNSATVNCSANRPAVPPTAWINDSADPTIVNQTFTVTWGSTNANSCQVDKRNDGGTGTWGVWNAWGANNNPSGTQNAAPAVAGQHEWRNVCTGPGGTATAYMTHTVNCAPGYTNSGGNCVPITYSCGGTRPSNTSMCSGDATSGLSSPANYSRVAGSGSCTAAQCEYYCSSGYSWNGSSCVLSSSLYPDLQSINLRVTNSGPFVEGGTLSLAADVRNNHSVLSGTFHDNFSYRWSTIASWTDITPFISKPSLGLNQTSADALNFILNGSGTLYIQHCVDSNRVVDEGPFEGNNCSPLNYTGPGNDGGGNPTVFPRPDGSISATSPINWNTTTSVTWWTDNLSNCSVTSNPAGGGSWSGTDGTQTSNALTQDTTFTLRCTSPVLFERSFTVIVEVDPDLRVEPRIINAGETVDFIYDTQNQTCTISGGGQTHTVTGTGTKESDPINGTTTFTIDCPLGEDDDATVEVRVSNEET